MKRLHAAIRSSGVSYFVPPPPTTAQRNSELQAMKANIRFRTPAATARAVELDQHGATSMWLKQASLMRSHIGLVRGGIATGLMVAAMGTAALVGQVPKRHYDLQRPFEMDSSIKPLGPIPHDPSYPSGHATASEAAATVLANFDPDHAAEYEQLAQEVAAARVYSAVHLPSDVQAGHDLGHRVGEWFS